MVLAKRMIFGPLAAVTLAACLGACSIWAVPEENARPARSVFAPQPVAVAPTPAPAPSYSAAAPGVVAPAAPVRAAAASDNTIVVPGPTRERQVTPPSGDPRSVSQRMADIRAWDDCVMHAQNVNADPLRPSLDSPEDICRQRLGMSRRNAVPDSRRP
jgi:hypothetical protein